jgi:hypothetical protein
MAWQKSYKTQQKFYFIFADLHEGFLGIIEVYPFCLIKSAPRGSPIQFGYVYYICRLAMVSN